MPCPHASGSLSRLPGKKYDDSARRLRQQFLDGEIDAEQFVKENAFVFPHTKERRFQNQIQTYATASIVIDSFWSYLKQRRVDAAIEGLKHKCASAPYDKRVEGFFDYCSAIVGIMQKQYVDDIRKRDPGEDRTHAEKAFLCFGGVARKRHIHLKGLPFPSMKDLIAMISRMAQVVPKVFERDTGREPSLAEIMGVLRHPSIGHFFTQLMMNDRYSSYPLFAMLEGCKRGNLNDRTRRFDPQYFELHRCDGSVSLRLKPAVIEEYRSHYTKAEARRIKRGKLEPRMLGCPVLYTGLFREMFDWTCDMLERWL